MKNFLKRIFGPKLNKIFVQKKQGFQTVFILNNAPPPPVIKRKRKDI